MSRRPTRKKSRLRRIAVVTGTRAEYGLLRSTMIALKQKRNVQLQIVVTGSHLLRKFGYTIDEIRADGWPVDARIPMQRGDDSPLDQARGLARGVEGIARFLTQSNADIVLVLGDRMEAMAAGLAAVATGRILAHIHGGDLAAGDFDDALRHSITKLAHLHFPATKEAAHRIVRMGEPKWRVKVVGAPGLDRIRELARSGALRGHLKNGRVVAEKKALVIQHPCGRGAQRERSVMLDVLGAVAHEGLAVRCIYPNTDRGHRGIIEAINDFKSQSLNGSFEVVRSMARDEFLQAMHAADVLVGNSSSGIIEAASVGTPAVNIGARQQGRQTSGASVIHCAESIPAIRRAIRRALQHRPISAANRYGDGRAGQRIARTLSTIPLSDELFRKINSY